MLWREKILSRTFAYKILLRMLSDALVPLRKFFCEQNIVEHDDSAVLLCIDTDGDAANHFDASVTFRGQMDIKLKLDSYEGNAPLREYLAQFNLIVRALERGDENCYLNVVAERAQSWKTCKI